jgi:exosortase D (VPLPA-CTERM-specific)
MRTGRLEVTAQTARDEAVGGRSPEPLLIIGAMVSAVALAHWATILNLVERWISQPEYTHGFFIPAISASVLWARRDAISRSIGKPSWLGVVLMVVSCAVLITGVKTDTYALYHGALLVAVFELALAFGGWSLVRVTAVPLAFLVFMVPLPPFISSALTLELQNISSELGVAFIRLFQIPVHLEGNIIDLGGYQLGIVEACSGLRYLIPFLSLGFIGAYLYRGPLWQKAVVFVAVIPITIVMNGARIAMIGVISQVVGISYAEGFLHYLEGWTVFIACIAILYGVMASLAALNGDPNPGSPLRFPHVRPAGLEPPARLWSGPFLASLAILTATGAYLLATPVTHRFVPDRAELIGLPYENPGWRPQIHQLDRDTEDVLGADDYVIADLNPATTSQVNLYVAYLDYQRDNRSWHSPQQCIPGGGWTITALSRVPVANADGPPTVVNRVVITKGGGKQLVYYWYRQRGMEIADELWLRLLLFRDGLIANRTDGALVRLTTPVLPDEELSAADARLAAVLAEINPVLPEYVPD